MDKDGANSGNFGGLHGSEDCILQGTPAQVREFASAARAHLIF
jgi:hypothetical protein